ncbi:MAG TPA: acetamidase/formamidase family protein [Stellaceae bacterium]|jgi:formamidase|nr:acetamidase/formamidase family protein [Stellaceae bacterium]
MKSITVDYTKRLAEEAHKGHNRWHEAIPPVVEAALGEEVEIHTRDAFDGQITPATTAPDLLHCDLNLVHPLTGPVYVAGAQPGDLLEVEIRDMKPAAFAYTVQVPGFGFLRDAFPDPYIAKWAIKDGFAESADLPDVRIPDGSFVGVIGVAPSKELREKVQRREAELAARGGVALPPEAKGAVPAAEPIASEALRTIPPRENGGNMDIKQLSRGARLLLPVFVDGALFSVGDAHFAQGDGEACGTAIEMSGSILVRFSLHKGEAQRRGIRFPRFSRNDYYFPPELAAPKRFLATTGMSVHPDGTNESEDTTLSAKNALLSMIDLLVERGWTRQQAYAICSVAVDLKISELVDVPNMVVSAFLPLDIFGRDNAAR